MKFKTLSTALRPATSLKRGAATLPLHLFIWTTVMCLISCTVSNNLYVNNPVPLGKGHGEAYLGIGTGVTAGADSVSIRNGKVYLSNKISTAANLCAGFQVGLSKQTDLRVAIHLPRIIGGFGLRAGIQHSFFNAGSPLNMALGADLGFVAAKDSIKILGSNTSTNPESRGTINADFFLPVSYKVNDNCRIVFTPRYSFNTFWVQKYDDRTDYRPFRVNYPALSLGLRFKKFHFETTLLSFDHAVYPHFGIAWLFLS